MSRHVLVVGGGVVGLFSALYARQAGFDVTVIDRSPPEYEGASFGNAGFIVPSHFVPLAAPGAVALGLRWMFNQESPFFIRPSLDPKLAAWAYRFWRASSVQRAQRAEPVLCDLHMASKAGYVELAERLGNSFDLHESGLLMLCTTEAGLEEEIQLAHKARSLGLPVDVLTPDEVRALEPEMNLNTTGGVYFRDDAALHPSRLMSSLRVHLKSEQVEFCWNTAVQGLAVDGARVAGVLVEDGTLMPADEVVLAAGVWSGDLARSAGLRIPMLAGKGYSMTVGDPPERPSTPVILSEGRVAVSPLRDSVRFGGTMEVTGVREGVAAGRVRGIVKSVIDAFPTFREEEFSSTTVWYGFRPFSPDGLPYLGRTRRVRNLTIATGHAMMGVSLAPITGMIVSDLLQGQAPRQPIELLSPDRYS